MCVCLCVGCVYIFASMAMFSLASSQISAKCRIMLSGTLAHIQANECVHAKKQLLSISHTHTQTRSHTLSLVNGIKSLSDNSPDGQTRNQASISPPASFPPYPLNHSLFLTHAHRHLLHTWNYNYIFRIPAAAKQRSNYRDGNFLG